MMVMYNEYIVAIEYNQITTEFCGPRSTNLVLCDPSVDNASDIQKIIKIYESDLPPLAGIVV
jgi:hypothetical protein